MFTVKEYKREHSFALYKVLRSFDRKFLRSLSTKPPQEALTEMVEDSDHAFTYYNKGKVVAIMGYKDDNAWMLSSSLTKGQAMSVVRSGKEAFNYLPNKPLYVIAPKTHARDLLLCKSLGFTIQTAEYPNYLNSGIDHIALWRVP